MRSNIVLSCIIGITFLFGYIYAKAFEELVPDFNRKKSSVMIRRLTKPTMASLDYAAYSSNPVRYDKEKYKPKKPEKTISLKDIKFKNALISLFNSIDKTPLKKEEIDQPMAWQPLQNLLWTELKIDKISNIGNKIIAEKWADPNIFQPYQEIAALYLHKTDTGTQIWVKVEFSPWVNFLSGITDSDKDGFIEIYGKLNLESVNDTTQKKVFNWIRTKYLNTDLNRQEVIDWANELASYWYPTLNTDIVDLGDDSKWPTQETEKKIKKKVKGINIDNPVAVIRGNPHGKPIYNVFIVEGIEKKSNDYTEKSLSPELDKKFDKSISTNFIENNKRFEQETRQFENYSQAYTHNKKNYDHIKKILLPLPEQQMGIEGMDGWLFFRKSLDYIIAKDLTDQPDDKNPLPHLIELKKYLDKSNVNLLFVPVPVKAEVYPEKLGINVSQKDSVYINPYGRKILHDLQKAGIEVIDLLPCFIKAKKEDKQFSEPLFQKQDTHWTNRGLQITAKAIAQRIKEYSWYKDYKKQQIEYNIIDTTISRLGDIVDRLPEQDKTKYHAVSLEAQQVRTNEDKEFKTSKTAPIILMGDSFIGVFELIDCKSAGVGAHIAAKTGLPIDIILSWGGGPMVRSKLVRKRNEMLGSKQLVIYLMVARDLFNYSQGWDPLQVK